KLHVVANLSELALQLGSEEPLPELDFPFNIPKPPPQSALDAIQGQALAKRALEVALAGRHHLLLVGPPGVGKSLLAHAARSLLPPLEKDELIALVKHQGFFDAEDSSIGLRPFRDPHHSISAPGL